MTDGGGRTSTSLPAFVTRGAVTGLVAGMAMALVVMLYGLVSTSHAVWDAPMAIWSWAFGLEHFGEPANHVAPIVLGMAAHMMNSVVVGIFLSALLAAFRPRDLVGSTVIAVLYALGVWAVMRYVVLPLNEGEARLFTTDLVAPQWVSPARDAAPAPSGVRRARWFFLVGGLVAAALIVLAVAAPFGGDGDVERPLAFEDADPSDAITFELHEESGSGYFGYATLVARDGGKTEVRVKLNKPVGIPIPAGLYSGECGDVGERAYELNPVEQKTDTLAESTTVLDEPLGELLEGGVAITVREPGADPGRRLVCGDARRERKERDEE